MKEPTFVRIKKKDYDELLRKARLIDEESTQDKLSNVNRFKNRNVYPTISSLKQHNVEINLKKYVPYLLYYKDIYQSNETDFLEAREYIQELFDNWVEIIPEKAYLGLEEISSIDWKKKTLEERIELLEEFILFYGFDEFETFLGDLGWMRFMRAYRLYEVRYNAKEYPKRFYKEMKTIWNIVQKIE